MGGLAGILHLDDTRPDLDALGAAARSLAHRGPDGEGGFAEGPIALAHHRRALVPTRSQQPLVTDDLVVMMDGWIYDHLKVALAAGDRRTDLTDVEALALAWRRWGSSLTQHLDGDFAAVFWERGSQRLHLVRDRMGVRPLYWSRSGDRIAFASELPALLRVPWVQAELDPRVLAEYLSFRVVHAPRTMLRGIQQLEPASWLRFDARGLTVRSYWSVPYAKPKTKPPSAGKAVEILQDTLQQAVRRRLASGAPAALFLSGGLGSTAIAIAAGQLGMDLPSWTIGFADDPNPELPFAGRVARLLGLEHQDVLVGSGELASAFDRTVQALGHPIGSPTAILQLLLAERVRPHARIVLAGDGGDELFGGRMLDAATRGLRRTRLVGKLPRALRGPSAHLLTGHGPVDAMHLYGLALEVGGARLFSPEARGALFADASLARPYVRHEVLVRFYEELDTDPVNGVLHAFLCSGLREGRITQADRIAGRVDLDARFPLLDRDVVEAAAKLPGSFKVGRRGGTWRARWPLRALLQGVLPTSLVNRAKRGPPAPLDRWLANSGRLFLEERATRLEARDDLFKPLAVRDLVHKIGKVPGAGMQVWSLFILDAWLHHLDVPRLDR